MPSSSCVKSTTRYWVKVLSMLADDIVELHREFYPETEQRGMGWIVWRTTQADSKKPGYGTRTEDYRIKTVVLPLVTEEDVEARMVGKQGKANGNYIKHVTCASWCA
jgi:hypothetical protein